MENYEKNQISDFLISPEIVNLKRIFLDAEKEYVKELVNDPSFQELLKYYKQKNINELCSIIQEIHNRMELGIPNKYLEDNYSNLEIEEIEMILALLALEGKVIELVKIKTRDNKENNKKMNLFRQNTIEKEENIIKKEETLERGKIY